MSDGSAIRRTTKNALVIGLLAVVLYHLLPHARILASSYLRLIPIALAFYLTFRWLRTSPLPSRKLALALLVLAYFEQFSAMRGFRYIDREVAEANQFGFSDDRIDRIVCQAPHASESRWLWKEKTTKRFCAAQPDSAASATFLTRNHDLKLATFRRVLALEEPSKPFSLALFNVRWFAASEGDLSRFDSWGLGYERKLRLSDSETLVEMQSVLPRAYLALDCELLETRSAVLSRFHSGNFKLGNALLEIDRLERPEAWRVACAHRTQSASPQRVPIAMAKGDRLELAQVNGPGVLVLSDSFYSGWKARDQSGQELSLAPVNLAFRAVLLPETRAYSIVFSYEPWWLVPTRIVFWSACAVCALALMELLRAFAFRRRTPIRELVAVPA